MNWQRNRSYMILQSIHTERIGGPFQAVFAPESYYNFDNTNRLFPIPHRDIRRPGKVYLGLYMVE